jgi:hypothetical protein
MQLVERLMLDIDRVFLMTYPPIPPNSPFFADGEFHWPDTFHWDLNNPCSARPIIAAVAQAAWSELLYSTSEDQARNAMKNTEEWRQWGRKGTVVDSKD